MSSARRRLERLEALWRRAPREEGGCICDPRLAVLRPLQVDYRESLSQLAPYPEERAYWQAKIDARRCAYCGGKPAPGPVRVVGVDYGVGMPVVRLPSEDAP